MYHTLNLRSKDLLCSSRSEWRDCRWKVITNGEGFITIKRWSVMLVIT